MTPHELIGESIERLACDYDLALVLAGFDESMVTMYLPAEWTVLARRVCALIAAEVDKRAAAIAVTGPAAPEACPVCGYRLWLVSCDPVTLRRGVSCAGCGMACHV